MKYSITAGQLIVLWIFGALFCFFGLLAFQDGNGEPILLIWLSVSGFLTFYTVGWWHRRKQMRG